MKKETRNRPGKKEEENASFKMWLSGFSDFLFGLSIIFYNCRIAKYFLKRDF